MKKVILILIIIAILVFTVYQVYLKKEEPSFDLTEVIQGELSQEISETGMVKKGNGYYSQINPTFYFTTTISSWMIIFALIFSFSIGCLAGFFPARSAAKLKPVEALRKYE